MVVVHSYKSTNIFRPSFRKFPNGKGSKTSKYGNRGAGHLSVCVCISTQFLGGSGGMFLKIFLHFRLPGIASGAFSGTIILLF